MESTDRSNRHNNDGRYPAQSRGRGQETLDIYRHQTGGEPGHVAHPSSLSDLHQRLLTGSGVGGDHVGDLQEGADPSRPELGQFSRQLLTNPFMHPFGNAGVLAGGSENVASLPYLAGESEHVASSPYLAGGSEHVASAAYPPPQDFQGIQPIDPSLSLTGDHTHFELHALASQIPPAFSGGTFAGTYGELPGSPDGTSLLSPTSTFADSPGSPTVYGDVASSYGSPTVYSDFASSYPSPEGFSGPYVSPFSGNQLDALVNLPAYPVGTPQAVSGDLALPSRPPERVSRRRASTNVTGNDTLPRGTKHTKGQHAMNADNYRKNLQKTEGGKAALAMTNKRGDELRTRRYRYVRDNYPDAAKTIRAKTSSKTVLSIVNAERAKKNEKLWTIQDLNAAAEEHVLRKKQEEQLDA